MQKLKKKGMTMGLVVSLVAALQTGTLWADELKQEEHPSFQASDIRSLTVEEAGEVTFAIDYKEYPYKSKFDYWEITVPYEGYTTTNTETMYELFQPLAAMKFTNPVEIEEEETGLAESSTKISLEFVQNENKTGTESYLAETPADSEAVIVIGNQNADGNYYASVEGYEEEVYLIPENTVNTILEIEPFSYILRISSLINLDTVDYVEIQIGEETYVMKPDGDEYLLDGKKTDKEVFTTLYQDLMSVLLETEIKETLEPDREKVLSITYYRNSEEAPDMTIQYFKVDDVYDSVKINELEAFLVKDEEVEGLIEKVKMGFAEQ